MPLFSLQMDSLVPFPLVLAQFVLVHSRGKYNQIFLLWLLLAELVGCLFCRTVGLTVAMMSVGISLDLRIALANFHNSLP